MFPYCVHIHNVRLLLDAHAHLLYYDKDFVDEDVTVRLTIPVHLLFSLLSTL